jgi:hypothetical protein
MVLGGFDPFIPFDEVAQASWRSAGACRLNCIARHAAAWLQRQQPDRFPSMPRDW